MDLVTTFGVRNAGHGLGDGPGNRRKFICQMKGKMHSKEYFTV